MSGKITGDNRYISIDTHDGLSEYAKVVRINKKLFGRNTLLLAMDVTMHKSHKDSLAFLDPAQIFQTSGRKLKIVRFDHGELLIEPKVLELGLVRLMGKKETDLENLAYEKLYNFQAKYNAGEIREYQAVL